MAELRVRHGRNLIESVRDIPVLLPPPGASYAETEEVSEWDMGKDDPNTIAYINVKTNNIPPGHEARIKELEEMMDKTHQWLDINTGIQTRKQINLKTLPDDMSKESQLKRSDYRAKVVDTIMSEGDCAWIVMSQDEFASNGVSVKKADFHIKILQDILAGITTVSAISEALEAALSSLSDLIIQNKDEMQGHISWNFFNVFTWDDVTQDVKGAIRIILYNVSGEMVQYTVHKASYEEVNLEFDFHQSEYTFDEDLWADLKGDVNSFLDDYGHKKVRDPIPGGVTP